MINKRKLKSIIVLNGDNFSKLSSYLGINLNTFSEKINEKRKAGFTQKEIKKIKDKYNLSAKQIDEIFFNN